MLERPKGSTPEEIIENNGDVQATGITVTDDLGINTGTEQDANTSEDSVVRLSKMYTDLQTKYTTLEQKYALLRNQYAENFLNQTKIDKSAENVSYTDRANTFGGDEDITITSLLYSEKGR